MRATESVYIVSGGYYGLLGNVYAIRGKHAVLLIDSGQDKAIPIIEESLAYWGMGDLPVAHVLITHGHHDHAGGARHFQQKGAKIHCGAGDAAEMARGGLLAADTPWGEEWEFAPCTADALLHGGDTVAFEDFRIRVVGAPGHSAGSLFFLLKDGDKEIMFTGDSFSCDGERGEQIILGWKGAMDYDFADFKNTIDKAYRTLNPDCVLGGHGIPCLRDGKRVIRNAYRKLLLEYR